MIRTKVIGLDKIRKTIKGDLGDFKRNLRALNQKTAMMIETDAKINAQRSFKHSNGHLANRIVSDYSGNTAEVRAETFYAPYVEFGTGAYAKEYLQDKEEAWRQYAMEFYKNGQGTMPAKPYLFPAALKHREDYLQAIEDLIIKRSFAGMS